MADGDYAIEDAFPVHTEEAFQRGIQYQARYIGSMDVQRPQSRAEIVSAMRRVRFEFKAKAAKKRKVVIAISLDGVSLIFKRPPKQRPPGPWHEGSVGCGQLLMHHPIYRIFYVSHDSQDLKIFSYIARDSHRNAFKCNVFKASKKAQAVRIVRTIGQAFEICHQLSLASKEQQQMQQQLQKQKHQVAEAVKIKEEEASELPQPQPQQTLQQSAATSSVSTATSPTWDELLLLLQISPLAAAEAAAAADSDVVDNACPLARHHSQQLMRQELAHRAQQTQMALDQMRLLHDQLAAETAARVEAQARAQQLLGQNRDLLDHLNQLVHRTRALELRLQQRVDDPSAAAAASDDTVGNNFGGGSSGDSPDSGHKEMSSDSLSQAFSLSDAAYSYRAPLTPQPPPPQPPPPPPQEMLVPPQRRSLQAPVSLGSRPRPQHLHCLGAVASAIPGGGGGVGGDGGSGGVGGGVGGSVGGARRAASQSSGDVSRYVSVKSAAAVGAALAPAASTEPGTAAVSASTGAMPAGWTQPWAFCREDALSAAHLNHSFEWSGEASLDGCGGSSVGGVGGGGGGGGGEGGVHCD